MRVIVGLVVLMGALASSACSAPSAPASPPVTVTVQAPPSAVAAAPSAAVPAGGSASTWTMPDLVGANLQDAQNAIQSLTGFEIAVTASHDETGKGREQVLDRNWKVCSQNVRPGATITTDSEIDFGTVKLEESC